MLHVIVRRFAPVVLICLFTQATLIADIFPAGRVTQWKGNVGVDGGIPNRTTVYTTLPAGSSASQINAAIAACPSGQVVKLAAGTYNLGANQLRFTKDNVVLRGAGMNSTILVFSGSISGLGGCVVISGGDPLTTTWPNWRFDGQVNWTGGYAQGSTTLTVSSVAGLSVGSIVGLDQLNDGVDVFGVAAQGASGGRNVNGQSGSGVRTQEQWVEVKAINGNTVTVWPPLYNSNWKASLSPQMFWMNTTCKGVGIEDLTIDGSAAHAGYPYQANIYLLTTWNCWIKNVKSVRPYESHISMEYGGRTEVRHCYFYDTQFSASQSYGFQPARSSFSWMEDCIFEKVTAPVQVGDGGGHVISYNYATNCVYSPDANSFHSAFWSHQGLTTYVLYEGNYCGGVQFDDFHGGSTYQTVFRNVLTGEDRGKTGNTIVDWPYSYYVNVVGNVLGTKGRHSHVDGAYGSPNPNSYTDAIYDIGLYTAGVLSKDAKSYDTIYRHGNYDVVNNAIVWSSANSDHTIPASMIYDSKPSWFGDRPWPPFDPSSPSAAVVTNLPSGYRFILGTDPPTTPVVATPPATPKSLTVQ